jgi:CheY-like chemotaxis protein
VSETDNSPRVLVVEDNYFLATELVEELIDQGAAVIGPASNLSAAMELVEKHECELDAASLDVNLNGQLVFPVAEMLRAHGIPFVFATGYDVAIIPEALRDVPRIEKPVHASKLAHDLLDFAHNHHRERTRGTMQRAQDIPNRVLPRN